MKKSLLRNLKKETRFEIILFTSNGIRRFPANAFLLRDKATLSIGSVTTRIAWSMTIVRRNYGPSHEKTTKFRASTLMFARAARPIFFHHSSFYTIRRRVYSTINTKKNVYYKPAAYREFLQKKWAILTCKQKKNRYLTRGVV